MVWGQTFALPGILDDVEAAESLLADAQDRDARVIQMTAAIARRLVDTDPSSRTTLEALTERVCHLLAASPHGPDIADSASAPSVAAQWLGIVAMSDERWHDAESLLVAAEQLEASRGWSGMRAATLVWLAELRWRRGRWSEAESLVRLADVDHARSSAARAVRDAVLERDAAIRSAAPPSITNDDRAPGGLGDLLRHHGLALAALGANSPDVAVVHLRRAEGLADGALDHPGLVWWQGDLVEALAAAGDVRAADEALARLERRSARLDTPLSRAQLLRARAARQHGRTAVRLLTSALTLLEQTPRAVRGGPDPPGPRRGPVERQRGRRRR